MPDPDRLPTGHELADEYLEPLAGLPQLRPHLRLGTRVLAVARLGCDKLKGGNDRDTAPFVLRVATSGGQADLLARAVIDASGTYGTPNPLGASGLPAVGEAAVRDRVFYGIPDVLGAQRNRYAGRRVLVVGSGHSALNTLVDLATLAGQAPGTAITWVIRRQQPGNLFGGGTADRLPARGQLGLRARQLVDGGAVRLVSARVAALVRTPEGIVAETEAGSRLGPVDEIVAATGFRPDLSLLREVRLDLDPVTEAPAALAPLIDPNVHSCGTVPPHGAELLAQPERDLYIVGMKSYGRAPTFLMLTGYEQVRSVAAALTGDIEGARRVALVLPETGVCSGEAAADCCPAPASGPAAGGAAAGSAAVPLRDGAGPAASRLPLAGPGPVAADRRTSCCGA